MIFRFSDLRVHQFNLHISAEPTKNVLEWTENAAAHERDENGSTPLHFAAGLPVHFAAGQCSRKY